MSSSPTVNRYPSPLVSIAREPNWVRKRATEPWTTFRHDAGGSSPYRASANRSEDDAVPFATTSAASTTRSRRCSGDAPSIRDNPATRTRTLGA